MATKHWQPKATAVAQVETDTVGGTLSGETFTMTVNGVDIATHTDADTVIATTVAALVAAWNASTHAYAIGITSTDASPDIVLAGDTAGEPFNVTLNTPGGSATFVQVATTDATGPNQLDEAENWGGSLPSNDDIMRFENSAVDVLWGLDQLSTTGHNAQFAKTYTGKVGLASAEFLVGGSQNASAPEYRQDYMQLDILRLEIGQHVGPGSPSGSSRLKIDNDRGSASTTIVYGTASSSADSGLPAVRLLLAHASADIDVRAGDGGTGVAMDHAGETSTIGDVTVQGGKCYIGAGVTLTSYANNAGVGVLNAAATVGTVNLNGGTLTTEGDYTITTLTTEGGTLNANHIKTAANAVTTANINGGTVDAQGSGEARTWATVNVGRGATVKADTALTITTLNEPSTGQYSLSVS